jgi:ABC-type amino acid transport substrate-binding protein
MTSFRLVVRAALGIAWCAGALPGPGADSNLLRVGVTPVFPPIIHREGGKLVGVEADFAQALGRELGRPVKFVELKWDDQFAALEGNRTDIIMSSLSITRPRQFRAAFSRPYLTIGQLALVRRTDAYQYALGFPARPPGVVGVIKGTTGDFLVQQEFPSARRRNFDTADQAARALARKQIGLFICDSPTIWWLAGMNEEAGLVTVPFPLTEENLAWAVRKSDAGLLEAVNRALEKLQARGEAAAIIKRWIPLLK